MPLVQQEDPRRTHCDEDDNEDEENQIAHQSTGISGFLLCGVQVRTARLSVAERYWRMEVSLTQ